MVPRGATAKQAAGSRDLRVHIAGAQGKGRQAAVAQRSALMGGRGWQGPGQGIEAGGRDV